MDLVEIYNQSNPAENPSVTDKIAYALPQIFNFEFPFFDESKRTQFETMFVMRFYTRQLGFEMPALWQFNLQETLNRIMPYYNEYFQSQLLDYEPFQDIFLEETYSKDLISEKTGSGTTSDDSTITGNKTSAKTGTDKTDTTGNATGTDTNKKTGTEGLETSEDIDGSTSNTNKYSDTPQGLLNNLDYLTNMTTDAGTTTQTTDGNSTTTYDVTDTRNTTNETTGNETTTYDTEITDNSTQTTEATRETNTTDTEKALENYTRSKKGMSGKYSYPELLNALRSAIINVYDMIFNSVDIRTLFILYEDI